jgi:hypothetical protein
MAMKRGGHIYKHGAKSKMAKHFKHRYGSHGGRRGKGGKYVHGAVIGRLTRQ